MFTRKHLILGIAGLLFAPLVASAQSGRGGSADPAALAEVKTQIQASDEEWTVIGAKLKKVIAARAVVEANMTADGTSAPAGGRGGRGGNDSFGGPSDRADGGRGGPGGARGGADAAARGGPDRGGRGGPDAAGPRGGAPNAAGPRGGGPDGGGPRGGGPGPGGGGGAAPRPAVPSVAVNIALTALQKATTNPSTTPAELEKKTAAVRKAREWSKTNLDAAQNELIELLTDDQRAVLVSAGYLD